MHIMAERKNEKSVEKEEEEDGQQNHLLKEFANNTTAHGFSQIVLSNHILLKILWVLVIIGFNVVLYFQINPLVQQYLSKPIKTKIVLKSEQRQLFPMVTICNTNILRESKVSVLRNTAQFKGKDHLFPSSLSQKVTPKKKVSTKDSKYNVDSEAEENFNNNLELQSLMSSIAEQDGPAVFKYGHQFNEMFEECKWKEYFDCADEEFWEPVWHWKYGNCFAFNTGKNESLEYVTETGPYGGLSLKLNVNQDEYFEDYVTDTAAIVLHIGEPFSRIEPYHNGFSLAPNYAHNVNMKVTKIHRVDPFRNGSCTKDHSVDLGKRSFSQRKIDKHSLRLCKDICLASEQIKACGCSSFWLPSLQTNKTCVVRNDTLCVERVIIMYKRNELPCLERCAPPCEETQYNVYSSSRAYPTARMLKDTTQQYNDKLKVTIGFATLETQAIIDEEYYAIENLLGDIGGQLGLWSGFSLMTLIEVVFLLFQGFFFVIKLVTCRPDKTKDTKKNKTSQEPEQGTEQRDIENPHLDIWWNRLSDKRRRCDSGLY